MSIFLYSIALCCFWNLSDTALRFYLYLKLCIFEFWYFYFKNRSCLITFDLIWKNSNSEIPWPGYEHSPVHRRPSSFMPCFWYCLTVFLVSQALHLRIPKPDDLDMSIYLYIVALHCSCLLSDTALRFPCISSVASPNSVTFLSQ